MTESVLIPARFNGPVDSGNGGYSAGIFAAALGGGPAEVTLRSPIPLDEEIAVAAGEGEELRFSNGETLVAEARPAPGFAPSVPEPVTIEQARVASEGYPAPDDGLFSRCFVCGRAREDCFGVFAGPLEGRQGVASPWTPPQWTADGSGQVAPEFAWAVLDCPTYFAAFAGGELPIAFMGRVTANVLEPAVAGEEHVVAAWPIENDRRKHRAGSALFSADGRLLAVCEVLLIEPR